MLPPATQPSLLACHLYAVMLLSQVTHHDVKAERLRHILNAFALLEFGKCFE